MARLSDLSVRQLYEAAGSTAPTPGGGSVTALCGVLGIALILKALRLTLRHHPELDAMASAVGPMQILAFALETDADDDVAAFEAFIAASKSPHTDEAEIAARSERMQRAATHAAEAAMRTMTHAIDAIALALDCQADVASNVKADISAGVHLLRAVAQNAVDNARGNLQALHEGPEREALEDRLRSLERLSLSR